MSHTTYKVLLIKPRWYLMSVLEAEGAVLRETHPGIQISVIADEKLEDETIIFYPMPDLRGDSKLSLLHYAQKIRTTTYDEIVVLADNARSEAGYLEAKIWAFAAKGRVRRLGSMKRLDLKEELKDKWRRIVIQKVVEKFIRIYHQIDLRIHPEKRKFEDQYDNGLNSAEKRLAEFIKRNTASKVQK